MHITFVLAACIFAAVEAASDARLLKAGLTKQCKFMLGGQQFDLCPIVNGDNDVFSLQMEKQTPPTITTTEYKIALREPLQMDSTLPSHEQCPEGTWVCMTMTNTRPHHESEPPRVLQTIPVAGELSLKGETKNGHTHEFHGSLNTTAQLSPSRQDSHHDVLHIRLHGGFYVGQFQKADIQFVCDHKAEEPTWPSYSWTWNGTHTFNWRTKHACGTGVANPPSTVPPPSAPTTPDNDTPPVDDEDPGEADLADPPFSLNPYRQSLFTLFISSAAIFGFIYCTFFPPPAVRRYVHKYMRSHPALLRSRVGEQVLVRWVQEDLDLTDGEEDLMVNGGNLTDDEQIPLKPSPRPKLLTNYGTAR